MNKRSPQRRRARYDLNATDDASPKRPCSGRRRGQRGGNGHAATLLAPGQYMSMDTNSSAISGHQYPHRSLCAKPLKQAIVTTPLRNRFPELLPATGYPLFSQTMPSCGRRRRCLELPDPNNHGAAGVWRVAAAWHAAVRDCSTMIDNHNKQCTRHWMPHGGCCGGKRSTRAHLSAMLLCVSRECLALWAYAEDGSQVADGIDGVHTFHSSPVHPLMTVPPCAARGVSSCVRLVDRRSPLLATRRLTSR